MTKAEEAQLVTLLSKLEPGFLPFEIFLQIARLVTLPIIEVVPLKLVGNAVEVLMLSRGADDPLWPNQLHAPGTVIRATDTEEKMYKAFDRILDEELKGTRTSDPYYVGSILHRSKRGAEQAQIFWVEVLEEPKTGTFYPADNLPGQLISSQTEFIKQAANSFKNYKNIK